MRRVSLAIALLPLLAAGVASSGCGVPTESVDDPRSITVHPRVVVDGTWELASRDRVVIDEMLFHAPDVTLRPSDANAEGTDVLATDPDDQGPLLFRYDITSDGFGDIVGGARQWRLDATEDANLVFDFEPFVADVEALSTLEADTGVPLDALAGNTAMVHGYLLTSSSSKSTGFGNGCDGANNDGDPDGNPAACADDTRADGDPDGNPSRPENDGDPDGNPADGNPFADLVEDGDPDGNPAKPRPTDGDPDGNPAKEAQSDPGDGDPDGNPSKGQPESSSRSAAMHTDKGTGSPRPVGAAPSTRVRVPFVLVLKRQMSLSVPVADLFAEPVASGEVLPIDLHVQLDDLITDELLALLNQEAARQDKGIIVVEVPDVAMQMNVATDAVVHVRREAVSNGGIQVVGGR